MTKCIGKTSFDPIATNLVFYKRTALGKQQDHFECAGLIMCSHL